MPRSKTGRIRAALERIKRLFRRRPDVPEDPYAYVTAPKKPRPPGRSAAAVAEKPDDFRARTTVIDTADIVRDGDFSPVDQQASSV